MKINAASSYRHIKEDVNNTYEVMKDALSIEEISDIILNDSKHPVIGLNKLFVTIALANLEARNDIMEDRILKKVSVYLDYLFNGGKTDEFFFTNQDLLFDDMQYIINKYLASDEKKD